MKVEGSPWMIGRAGRFQPDPELAYQHFLRRLRDVILCVVPKDTTVLVMSNGDDDLLRGLHNRRALHFPEDEAGGHGGNGPADGAAAVAALESSRERGAHFLVVPANAQAWLDAHPHFGRHLEESYRLTVAEPGTCDIYALTEEKFRDHRDPDVEPEPRDLRPIRAIAPEDLGYRADPEGYFRWGWHGLRCIEKCLRAAGKETVESILDLPSGHGRVLRTLKARFPDAKLTACDIDRDGVDFCVEVLGATPVYSQENPANVVLPDTYDLIWCGSLLTHLSAEHCGGFLDLFSAHLRVGGVLVFTTHGHLYAELLRHEAINSSVLDPQQMVRDYEQTGFGYQDYMFGPPNVGFSLSSPAWVCRDLERHPELRLVLLAEREWGSHQDVFACVRMPGDEMESAVATHRHWLELAEGVGAREKLAEQYRSLHEYRDMVERIKEVVRSTLPQSATVVVVSRGDENLVQLGGVRGWHFPRDTNGDYMGHYPPDSASAIEHLEELRAQGADYFLLPATAFWWLDHYEELGERLTGRYQTVVQLDDTCLIFGLSEGSSESAVHAVSPP